MPVSRNTVSVVLILVAAVLLVGLIAMKWSKRTENFIEHFYDEKEYAMRQAVMNTFDTLVKRKATPKEIEKYSTEYNSEEDIINAIKRDFHMEDFQEAVDVTEEEEASFKIVEETPIKEELVPEPALLPTLETSERVYFDRAELRKYVGELRTFLNYLEERV